MATTKPVIKKVTVKKAPAKKVVKKTKKQKFATALNLYGKSIQNRFKYSNRNSKTTYAQALKTNKITNCARYVSWALQSAGVLPRGKVVYYTSSLKGSGKSYLLKRCSIAKPHKNPYKAGLKPYDVCFFKNHTMVYAGKNKSGKALWYSAGGGDVGRHKVIKVRKSYYDDKPVLIRARIKE